MKATIKRIQAVEPIDGWHVLHLADGTALGVRTDRPPAAGTAIVILAAGADDDTIAVLELDDNARDADHAEVRIVDHYLDQIIDSARRLGADETREALELEHRSRSWRDVLDDVRARIAATIAPRR
jgi:hypothetical protein